MSRIITAAVVTAFILASIGVGEQGIIDEYPHGSHVPLIQDHQHTGGTYVVYNDWGDPGTRDPVWHSSQTSISLASSGFDSAEKKATEAFSQPERLSLSEKHLDQMTYVDHFEHGYDVRVSYISHLPSGIGYTLIVLQLAPYCPSPSRCCGFYLPITVQKTKVF